MSALLALAGAGCAAPRNPELLETRLRQQEDEIAGLQGQLASTRYELKLARDESGMLRSQLQSAGKRTLVSEQSEVLSRTEGVKFSTLLTSGIDMDGNPGDDGLSVLLMPVDADGELVKLAGAVEFQIFDLSLPHAEQRIGEWRFDIDEARAHWHRGFMSAGYLFQLNWQHPPASTELTLHGRLIAPDGRQFNTTHTLHVKVPPAGASPVVTASQETKHEAKRVSPALGTKPAPAGREWLPPEPVEELPRVYDDNPPFDLRNGDPPLAPAAPLRTVDRFKLDEIPRLR